MSRQRIAVVGASTRRRKFGNKAVRAYLAAGWEVFPVNPNAAEVEGLLAWPSVAEVPGELDRISVYLPPSSTRRLIEELATRGAGEVWLNPGSSSPEISAAARDAGVKVTDGCSIVAIGMSPAQFP